VPYLKLHLADIRTGANESPMNSEYAGALRFALLDSIRGRANRLATFRTCHREKISHSLLTAP
jgi:hypothetical protein